MSENPSAKPSLLVVDDEEELVQIFMDFLGTGEYALEVARTGTEAIQKLKSRVFDVIVTDLNLPGADGLAVLRESKAHEPQTEVIMLTGNASTLTAVEALRQGAYDYVLKPFDLYEMDQTIHKALERRELREANRRFVEELRARVAEATERIRTLYEVGKEISSSLHLGRTLALILERSLALTGGTEGALYLLDEDGTPEPRVLRGVEEGSPAAEVLSERLLAPGREAVSRRGPVLEPVDGGPGPRNALVVPLLQEGEATGAIAVLAAEGAAFGDDDRDLLVSLAAQASIAINNARVYGKIRDLERMKSEFVAMVSHEIRTPLTSIKGTLEILSDDRYFPIQDKQRELFSICRANTDRLETLINDILDFSKFQEGSRLSTNLVSVRLDVVAESAIVQISKVAEKKRIAMRLEADPALPPVRADEARMIQVFSNLLSNAIKFSPEDTAVLVRLRTECDGVLVEIRDQGIGIGAEDLPKLFTRFRQLDSSSTRTAGGTGLGLVISRGILEEHGGRIWADSEPGKGSCFSFWIPFGEAGSAGAAESEAASRLAA